jgi:hypothetical protein
MAASLCILPEHYLFVEEDNSTSVINEPVPTSDAESLSDANTQEDSSSDQLIRRIFLYLGAGIGLLRYIFLEIHSQ